MSRIRIVPTAQRLMDKLYDGGLKDQAIRNWMQDGSDGFWFGASSYDTDGIEGEGTTLLKAIRDAVSGTIFEK